MKSLFLGDIDDAVRDVIKYFDKQVGKKSNDIYKKSSLSYEKLFLAKEYDTIFYFSKDIENMENLSDFISVINSSSNIKKYVYVIRNNGYYINNNEKTKTLKEILDVYVKKFNKNIIILNISCLYGSNFIDGEINYVNSKSVIEDKIVNYIHIEDFSKFLYMLSIHKYDGSYIEVKAPKSFKLKELLNKKIKEEINENINLPFEWKALHCISKEQNITALQNLNQDKKKNKAIAKYLEVIILFCIFELLNTVFKTTLQLQTIDFRLIYIVIISIYYSFKHSVLATILVVIALLISNLDSAYNLSVLANTDNWITIMAYIIITMVIRNKIKRFNNNEKLVLDKIERLEKQNKYKERNLKKYEIKIKELNKSIIMHDKSFSKIQNIITKYKNITTENIFEIFSNSLNTQNIVVLEINENKYINICAKENIDFSYLIEKTPDTFIIPNNIWVNNDLDKKMPLYIVPIFKDEKICYYVTIWDYEINIINHDYRNNLISLAQITSLLKENDR